MVEISKQSGFSFDVGSSSRPRADRSQSEISESAAEFLEYIDTTNARIVADEAAFDEQQKIRKGLPTPFAPYGSAQTHLPTTSFTSFMIAHQLQDALSLFGKSAADIRTYLQHYRPELSRVGETGCMKIASFCQKELTLDRLLPQYTRTLPTPDVNLKRVSSSANCFELTCSAKEGEFVECFGAFPLRFPLFANDSDRSALSLDTVVPVGYTSENFPSEPKRILVYTVSPSTRERSETISIIIPGDELDPFPKDLTVYIDQLEKQRKSSES